MIRHTFLKAVRVRVLIASFIILLFVNKPGILGLRLKLSSGEDVVTMTTQGLSRFGKIIFLTSQKIAD